MCMSRLQNFIPIKDWVFIDFVFSCLILYSVYIRSHILRKRRVNGLASAKRKGVLKKNIFNNDHNFFFMANRWYVNIEETFFVLGKHCHFVNGFFWIYYIRRKYQYTIFDILKRGKQILLRIPRRFAYFMYSFYIGIPIVN